MNSNEKYKGKKFNMVLTDEDKEKLKELRYNLDIKDDSKIIRYALDYLYKERSK